MRTQIDVLSIQDDLSTITCALKNGHYSRTSSKPKEMRLTLSVTGREIDNMFTVHDLLRKAANLVYFEIQVVTDSVDEVLYIDLVKGLKDNRNLRYIAIPAHSQDSMYRHSLCRNYEPPAHIQSKVVLELWVL